MSSYLGDKSVEINICLAEVDQVLEGIALSKKNLNSLANWIANDMEGNLSFITDPIKYYKLGKVNKGLEALSCHVKKLVKLMDELGIEVVLENTLMQSGSIGIGAYVCDLTRYLEARNTIQTKIRELLEIEKQMEELQECLKGYLV